MPPKPAEYAPRDDAIIRYTARYGIAIYPCLEKHFFDTGNCGTVAKRLSTASDAAPKKQPLLQVRHKSLPKGRTYVQLTPAGCRYREVSLAQAAPLGAAALDLAIAIQFACTFEMPDTHRVTHGEISPLLGSDTPSANVPHVVTASDGGTPSLLRIYHAVSDIQTCIRHLVDLAYQASARPVLSKWIASRDYGYLVLCPTKTSVLAMRSAIERREVLADLLIRVELGPTADTLDAAMRGLKS